MTLTELAIKRPSFIIVIFTILIGGGLLSYNQLSYELLPDFTAPILTVTTQYPGASPATVETQVAKPLEDALSGLENISDVTTFSMDNACIVLLEFKASANIDMALEDAQRKVNNILNDLPDGAKTPTLAKIDPNASPVLQVSAVATNMDDRDFMELMDKELLPQIKQTKGVAEVQVIGGEKRAFRVDVDKDKLKLYGLSLAQVNQLVAAANVEFPTGKLKNETEQMTVRLAGKFRTVDDLKNLIIFTDGTSSVRLGDVADVSDGSEDITTVSRLNGLNGIGLRIKKQSDANAVDMANLTKLKFKEIEEKYKDEGIKFTVATDTSIPTIDSVNAVLHDLELAVILVAVVMLLFLHSLRNAMIVLIAIPASLISTFIAMYLLGYTLNLMTLLAMSLVIGILVDDSIVVLENIYRHLQMGKGRRKAALDGRTEIGFTALAITLVDVVVFSPVVFIEGTISDILRQFSIVVVVSTLMSLFVCFTLTPWLASRLAKETKLNPKNPFQLFLIWFENIVKSFTEGYVKLVGWSLKHKLIMGLGILVLFFASMATMGLGIVGQEFVAQGDQGKFMVKLKYDKSTTFEENNATTLAIEQLILAQKDVVDIVFSNVGGPSSGMGAAAFGQENRSEITVIMKKGMQKKYPTLNYMNEIRGKIQDKFPGIEVKAINMGMVDSEEAPIEIFLSSDNPDLLMKEAQRLKEHILNIPGAKDPEISTDDFSPEVRIDLNREKMGQLGLPIASVGMQLQNGLTGNDDARFDVKGDEYDIRIMLDKVDRSNVDNINEMTFVTNDGKQVRLGEFADVSIDNGYGQLERKNRISNTTLRSYVLGTASGNVADSIDVYLKKAPLDKKVRMTWGGEVKRQKESMGALGTAMGIGLILVYLIMVALYDNFIYPFVVLFSILVSLIGAILALNLTSSNMGIFTMLGMLMLLGLVAKNAILIVDFTNHLKAEGRSTYNALLEAVRERMRPILMTTIAMVIGMIPIATATGSGAEWKNGLAWILIGGLTSSMFLTIIVVPMMYYIVDRLQAKFTKKKINLEGEDEATIHGVI
ncbi:efflux RND transporter permease subunit [Fluviicola sp.]|jgi:HAE1 family hydrophobic/amphiphilic exporter-1|uniref:efflux RND transporter permease subunit n=1 Tax=Fluviicola sp. TaxID=1917219 RepID=UPI00281C96FF|nr:efflux RND transporter permease subunit [Fluviicola sp.]MDR0803007.1 efflux RND transporter permease subunit [Fluviicola sp.]